MHERQLLEEILDSALDELDSDDVQRSTELLDTNENTPKMKHAAIRGTNQEEGDKKTEKRDEPSVSLCMDNAVNKLIENMKHSNLSNQNFRFEEFGENIMSEMMRDFESMAGKEDADTAIDGIMRQLLSKDLMYEPMKQVTEKFPQWLAENKSKLSEEEYIRYGTQYQYFQRILHAYDAEPDNISRLLELMQDIQQYGQPPSDIIKELAPDLDMDRDGFPSGFDFSIPGMQEGLPSNSKELDDCKMQ